MPDVEVKLTGLDGVLDNMAKLADKTQKQYATRALKAGAKPVQAAAVRNAQAIDNPATREYIAGKVITRTLGKRALRNVDRDADAGVAVGVARPKGDRSQLEKDEYLAGWWSELGTKNNRATPFMRPAIEAEAGNALDAIADSLTKSIFGG